MLSRRHFVGTTLAAAVSPVLLRAADPLEVVATTGMIADAAARIGGDLVRVRGLLGPGVDPHAYRQTRSDIVALTRADLVLWHGLYLEAQMEEFLLDLAARQPVVAVTDRLETAPDGLIGSVDYTDRFDPHVWMDPKLWAEVVSRVADALSEAVPDGKETFSANLEAYRAEILALDAYGETQIGAIPPEARVLITAHDAFAYFGRAYGMEVIGVQGISTESEAGLFRIRELVDLLVERQVRAVFVESSVSDQNIRALIEGAAARGHEVALGGELFSDAMGEAGTYEGTYIGMIDHNITTISRALGGDAPERGLNGRLAAGG